MKRFSNPLVPLAAVFAFLVLGVGVTVGIVIGVAVANHGVTIDAITSGAGAMIGAMLTVGAALGVFMLQERRAEMRRRDEIRPHALKLSALAQRVDLETRRLDYAFQRILTDGDFLVDNDKCARFSRWISHVKERLDEAFVIPVPGAPDITRKAISSFDDVTFFSMLYLDGLDGGSAGATKIEVPDYLVEGLVDTAKHTTDLIVVCEKYI